MRPVVLMLALMAAAVPQVRPSFDQVSKQAREARTADRAPEAIELYRAALNLRPAWSEGLWYLGTLLYEQEHYAEARDTLRRFVCYEPKTAAGWVLLGMSEYQTREYTRSLNHLLRALKLGVEDRDALKRSARYETAVLLTRFERFDESLQILLDMANAEPPTEPLIEAAGVAGLRLPMLPEEIPSERREMIRQAGAAICQLGAHRKAEAEALLKQLADRYPDEPGVHFLYGAFLLDGQPERGVAEMRRELEISPDHVPARVRLALEYLISNEPEKARPLAEQAVMLDPQSAAAHLALGRVLLELNDAPNSVRELEMARDQSPGDPGIRWALATAYARAGRERDAARERAETQKLKDRQHW